MNYCCKHGSVFMYDNMCREYVINKHNYTYTVLIYLFIIASDLISKVTILEGLISLHIYYSIGNTF